MDAILAVSALAMASAVAWTDWVISCCGVGSEAMSQMLDGQMLIMVTLAKQGGGYKNIYISGTVGPIYFKLGQCIGEGCALPLDDIIFMIMTSQGVYGCTKCIQDGFQA